MNERAANALWECFFGRPVTNRYYRGIADVPQVTASHDLKQLQTSGLIVAAGAGPSRSYTGTLDLARRVVELFDLDVDVRGSGELDAEVRGDITRALATKAAC